MSSINTTPLYLNLSMPKYPFRQITVFYSLGSIDPPHHPSSSAPGPSMGVSRRGGVRGAGQWGVVTLTPYQWMSHYTADGAAGVSVKRSGAWKVMVKRGVFQLSMWQAGLFKSLKVSDITHNHFTAILWFIAPIAWKYGFGALPFTNECNQIIVI